MSEKSKIILARRRFLKAITVLGASAAAARLGGFPVHGEGKQRFTILHNGIEEWQAIMDYLVQSPEESAEVISALELDARASETRAIRV
jgi:hypothetical protein